MSQESPSQPSLATIPGQELGRACPNKTGFGDSVDRMRPSSFDTWKLTFLLVHDLPIMLVSNKIIQIGVWFNHV